MTFSNNSTSGSAAHKNTSNVYRAFIVALFIIVKNWRLPKYLTIECYFENYCKSIWDLAPWSYAVNLTQITYKNFLKIMIYLYYGKDTKQPSKTMRYIHKYTHSDIKIRQKMFNYKRQVSEQQIIPFLCKEKTLRINMSGYKTVWENT